MKQKKTSEPWQRRENSSNKTQNSSKKLKVSANSFGRVAENRSKLEARAKGCYHECVSVGVNYRIRYTKKWK